MAQQVEDEVSVQWRRAAVQRAAAEVARRCAALAAEQRPKTAEKLRAVVRAVLRGGAPLFCVDPRDVCEDMRARGTLSEEEARDVTLILADAVSPSCEEAPIPRSQWPSKLPCAWLRRPGGLGTSRALARWIPPMSCVRVRAPEEEVLAELTGPAKACSLEDVGGSSRIRWGDLDAAASLPRPWASPRDLWIQKPLKGQTLSVQTALLISLPPSCPFYQAVQQIREKEDPAYERWMPHINIVYPFLPVASLELRPVRRMFKDEIAAFDLCLDDIGIFDHGLTQTLFLKPDEQGEKALRRLYHQVLAALPPGPLRGGRWVATGNEGKGKGKGKGKGEDESEDEDEDESEGEGKPEGKAEGEEHNVPEFKPHLTIAKRDVSRDRRSFDQFMQELRRKLPVRKPAAGIGGVIRGLTGEVWGDVTADNGSSWQLASGGTAEKAAEGREWQWQPQEAAGVRFRVDRVSLCERGADTPFEELDALALRAPETAAGGPASSF